MTATATKRRIPLWFWPVVGLWRVVTYIANTIGILLSLVIGAILMLVGFVLTGTIIGALIGIPLLIIGLLLFIRGLY